MKGKKRAYIHLLSYIVMIVVNVLANLIPIGGRTIGENAAKYDVLFMPAGYAFSIWLLIYLLLGVYAVWQILPDNLDDRYADRIGWTFPISCFFNAAWLIVWQYNLLALSMVAMTGLLVTVAKIYTSLEIGNRTMLKKYKYIVNLPFMVYYGWASTILIVNTAIFLYATNWYGFGLNEWFWACLIVVAVVALSVYILRKYNDFVFTIVQIWALIAVMLMSYYSLELVLFCIAGIIILIITLLTKGIKEMRVYIKTKRLT